jgi:hypothetical protein
MWIVDPNKVMSEILDGEAVIIDLASGRYHAAVGVAATVWEGVLCGHSFDQIMVEVHRAHTGVPDNASHAVKSFIVELVENGLAIPSTDALSASDTRSLTLSAPTPWSPPVLESHDDLADLMLIDPVHDVSELGWPNKPSGES